MCVVRTISNIVQYYITVFTADPSFNAVSPEVIIGLSVVAVLFNVLEGFLDIVDPHQPLRDNAEERV